MSAYTQILAIAVRELARRCASYREELAKKDQRIKELGEKLYITQLEASLLKESQREPL